MSRQLLNDAIGWCAALVLLLTVGRQVYTQWRAGRTEGVSKWLFVGQITASIGFVTYSALVGDAVFVATNSFMLLTACVGEGIYLHNRRRERRANATGCETPR